ncbi:quinol:cytochrome c oxidoreductase quinone-binding subunit 2 [Granulicella rosea]|uniref:Quinol:cytochrome c oxidoreductase quinone-binding subunit 2 n=1 Tax=Granulicella rosea TaxID=474952 RepID=A0A239DK09_9BACT|nr:hypothetical protein [Granulicella rosea]SNS32188.1 quinol:cytochrome c oxidoreductase quinone-binding subunit 2 [Granulicella rosea]
MSSGHSHHEEAGHHDAGHHHHGPKTLPLSLDAPEIVKAWGTRSLIVCAIFGLVSLAFVAVPGGQAHLLRAYLLGFMISFSFAGGGLALLMLQYVSGGKWGLLLRRPLEAMTRTLPIVTLLFLPIAIGMKSLYQWARFDTQALRDAAVKSGDMTREQAMTAALKHAMFSPTSWLIQAIIIFIILNLLMFILNRWSVERDADPLAGTQASYDRWRIKFENLSGPGIFVYVVLLTMAALDWVMSLDVTWYSSIWGLKFLVGQGYIVLALGILSVILLSKYEPMKTLLRTTEQHDLGKFAFAFVMLNIYLTFAEFLIIWSGNVPDEIPWYLARIHGGWWTICSLDFICHWLIPFCMLLSRNLKREKKRLAGIAIFMIFARFVDMFWLIEPNFKDAAGNLHLANNFGILAYLTVPVSVVALWSFFYCRALLQRPLVNVNDPHLEEILEPEHAH